MKTIDLGCDLSYQVNQPTSFLFQIAVAHNDHQPIRDETLTLEPHAEPEACRVGLMGNRTHRLLAQPGEFTLRYRAAVDLDQDTAAGDALDEVPHADLPPEVLPFLNPSRYCESDRLLKFAWDEFGQLPPGHHRVQAVTDWVHATLDYTPGSTGPTTTACDVLLQRAGVCRDYAHLAITLCRAMGIPARYVAGYAVDLQPPDFHGFFEAYLGDAWYLFDATKLAPVRGFVRIGAGRDAADLAFATLIGSSTLNAMSVWAKTAAPAETETDAEQAISSA
jgi:transglutaminase-like putative cysteine protease